MNAQLRLQKPEWRFYDTRQVERGVDERDNKKIVETYIVRIYISSCVEAVSQILSEYAFNNGACFTVEPTKFIYTGGQENGVVIGMVKYPKFEKSNTEIFNEAIKVAKIVLSKTFQRTCLVVASDETYWMEVMK